MSALPPKADIPKRDLDVRFVPKADIMQCSNRSRHARSNFRQWVARAARLRRVQTPQIAQSGRLGVGRNQLPGAGR